MMTNSALKGRTESVVTPLSAAAAHVRIMNVTKRLGGFTAVNDVSLEIPKGEMLTLLGPSGCGKSTTLRLLAGFYQPSEGEIFLGDERITMRPPNQRRMTMVFQEYALFPHLSVAENVGYGLKRQRMPGPQAQVRIDEMLELVGLAGAAGKYPHQMSGGQQQRVALARALAVDPEVLLLDEPLSNLDAKLRVRLREEIVRLQKVLGKTMVFVTHDQEEALSISDRIAVMRDGRIEQIGTPDEVYFRPRTRYVAEFVGLANFVEIQISGPNTIHLGPHELPIASGRSSGTATLMIRPQSLRVRGVESSGASFSALRGRIERKSFLGGITRYWVRTLLGEMIVDDPTPRSWPLAEEVQIELDVERLHLLPSEKDHESSSR